MVLITLNRMTLNLTQKEKYFNKKEFKNILMTELFNSYIQTNLFPEDYIGIIVYNILSKINIHFLKSPIR